MSGFDDILYGVLRAFQRIICANKDIAQQIFYRFIFVVKNSFLGS